MNKIYRIKLSPYHKIFFNEWQLNPSSSKYNIVFDQIISNTLDITRLKNALERLIADHFILNSRVTIIDCEPHWISNSAIHHLDVFNDVATYEQIYDYVSQAFNMTEGPLYRFAIFNQADGNYRFVLVGHHLLSDGCAFDELIAEVSLYYNDSSYKCKFNISQQVELILSLTDKFDKQLKLSASENKQFWKDSLSDLEALDLRFIKSNPSVVSESTAINIKELTFYFEADVVSKINQLKDKYGISIYSYGQIIFAILLHKYTSQNKFGLCYPIEIREFSGLVLGSGVNTNIFPFAIDKNTRISDLITHSKNFVNDVRNTTFNHRYLPISDIIAEFDKGLLDVFFIQTNLKDTKFDFDNANVIKINNDFNIDLPAKLLFEQEIKYQVLNYRVRYNVTEINETILKQFINHYQKLFMDILFDLEQNNSDKCIPEYQVLTTEEYNKIVYEWNETDKPDLTNKTIHELFEEQVLKTPNNIAVVYEDMKLTYQELNQRANQLAHYLLNTLELKPNSIIALYLDRSEYMLIAILAVLKTGSAYVPLDTKYPEARINYILEDARPSVILANECYKAKLHSAKYKMIFMDSNSVQKSLYKEIITNPQLEITNSNLVYIIYTSGTTGNPKGVLINHASGTNRILNMVSASNMHGNDRVLFKTNYIFDVSFSDIFVTLITGATLFVTKDIFDIDEIETIITNHKINICHFTPSQFDVIKSIKGVILFNEFKVINFSGEALNPDLVDGLNPTICCLNYYGPTESGEVTVDNVQISRLEKQGVTIGYPFDNTKLFILDNDLTPLPIGAVGELYISGIGIAVGYLNKDELTQERFIKNPFQTHKKYSELYKTGDLVRRLDNGNIEYIGRKDLQIKLRGYRIELGEIASQLLKFNGVKYAIAVVEDISNDNNPQQTENKCLIAYYLADVKLDEELMLDHLAQELPEYMLPKVFVHIDYLPLTSNGKLDKSLLPPADFTICVNNYVAPQNEIEQKICEIYADVLVLETNQVGINDDFFKLGGNSILAIRLVFKLQSYFDITINDIFEYKTPAKIARSLPSSNINLVDKLEQIKLMYANLDLSTEDNMAIEHKHTLYKQQVTAFADESKIKPDSKILLTGATGYLGCHILYQLLITTHHIIYLPIRADSNELACTRLCNKFKYYFDMDLNAYFDRLKVFSADLSKENLGLDLPQYEELINNIDSIIHSAALVKHYGNTAEFYLENVQATINLLELSKRTINKDFHYISTIGICTNTRTSDYNYNIFTEEILDNKCAYLDNIYIKTKYEGEQAIIKYQEYGVKTSIYRVGNLAINSATYKTQENIDDNAFFQRIKTIVKLGIVSQELAEVEISPVNCTANAITLLFNQAIRNNQIYHVFNPHRYSLYNLLSEDKDVNIKQVSLPSFIDTVVTQLTNNINVQQIELFMLHQWGLYPNLDDLVKTVIFQDKTSYLLDRLNFKWSTVTGKMFSDIASKC